MVASEPQTIELIEAYERYREYIALELHDNVLQTLASALHHIQAANQVAGHPDQRQNLLKGLHLIRQSIDAARGLMGELKPAILDRLGLVETMNCDLRQLRQETNWHIQFEAVGRPVPRDLELPLYRILREAIGNARKHSLSPSLRVRLQVKPSEVVAEVQDKGRGFDPSGVFRGTMGLLSMLARAQALGGECQIQSAVGQGTTVRVRLPVRENSAMKSR